MCNWCSLTAPLEAKVTQNNEGMYTELIDWLRFYVTFCSKGNIVKKKTKNVLKTYALVMLTDATATNVCKTGVQELWCAIYKINDDGSLRTGLGWPHRRIQHTGGSMHLEERENKKKDSKPWAGNPKNQVLPAGLTGPGDSVLEQGRQAW